MRSACPAASYRRLRMSSSPVIHRSRLWTVWPLASSCQAGSRKSGPVLKTRTSSPARDRRRARAATTVVLPWPEAGALTSTAGARRAGSLLPAEPEWETANDIRGIRSACGEARRTRCRERTQATGIPARWHATKCPCRRRHGPDARRLRVPGIWGCWPVSGLTAGPDDRLPGPDETGAPIEGHNAA